MTTGLCDHTRTGIHQNDRQVGCRTSGNHIPRILFMPRSIGNNELTVIGTEITISDIDCNTLCAFGLQTIEQQGIINMFSGISHTFAVAFQRIQLVFIQLFTVKQQTTNQRRFTIIHRSGSQKAQ